MEDCMSRKVTDFANSWVSENINAEPYEPGQQIIDAHVARMVAAAKEEGISTEELEDDLGDLSDFVSEAMEEATDNEVDRLSSKDD
jgi:hypothetical protein